MQPARKTEPWGSAALELSCCFSSALSEAIEMDFTPPKPLRRAFDLGVLRVGCFVVVLRVGF